MKKTLLFLSVLFCTLTIKAQSNYSDNQAKELLKQFYIAHIAVLNSHLQPTALQYKLDSLQGKYCTRALNKKLSRAGGNNDPFIANDGYTSVEVLNKTLNIAKDPTSENEFVVSYLSQVQQVGKPTELKIIVQVTVIKEADQYKIAAVTVM